MGFKKKFSGKQARCRFKPQHQLWRRTENHAKGAVASECSRNFERLSLPVEAVCAPGTKATILRPLSSVSADVDETSPESRGHRIVSVQRLCTFLTAIVNQHNRISPRCRNANITLPDNLEKFQGLGTTMVAVCTNCHYISSEHCLHEKIRYQQKGRPACELNVRLAAWHSTHETSFDTTRELTTYLDIPSISQKNLNLLVKRVSVTMEDVGTNQMEVNCDIIKKLGEHVGTVNVETDTAYNNPNKGQFFQGRGTQSVSPMSEIVTKNKLTLAIETFSQICTCQKRPSEACRPECPSNIAQGTALNALESTAAVSNILKLKKKGMVIGDVVADGNQAVRSSLQKIGVNTQDCTVHRSRGTRRQVFKCMEKLSSASFRTAYSKRILADAIQQRAQQELTLAKHKFSSRESAFKQQCERARGCILKCLAGDHSSCGFGSLACKGPFKRRQQLNGQRQFNLSEADINILQPAVDYKLSPEMVHRQSGVFNTNKSEAFHMRCFRLNPKSKTNRVTFRPRVLHAVTLDSIGLYKGTTELLTKIGLDSSKHARINLQSVDRRKRYHSSRQQSNMFKSRRHALRYQNGNKKFLSKLNTEYAKGVLQNTDHGDYTL